MAQVLLNDITKLLKNSKVIDDFLESNLFSKLPPDYQVKIKDARQHMKGFLEFRKILVQGINLSFGRDLAGLKLFFEELKKQLGMVKVIASPTIKSEIQEFERHISEVITPLILDLPLDKILMEGWKSFCLNQDIPFILPSPEKYQSDPTLIYPYNLWEGVTSVPALNLNPYSPGVLNHSFDDSTPTPSSISNAEENMEDSPYDLVSEIKELYSFIQGLDDSQRLLLFVCCGVWQLFIAKNNKQFRINRNDKVLVLRSIYALFIAILKKTANICFDIQELINNLAVIQDGANDYQYCIEVWRNELEPSST